VVGADCVPLSRWHTTAEGVFAELSNFLEIAIEGQSPNNMCAAVRSLPQSFFRLELRHYFLLLKCLFLACCVSLILFLLPQRVRRLELTVSFTQARIMSFCKVDP